MKWFLTLWVMTMLGLVGVYYNICNLQTTISDQNQIIAELTTEIVELESKDDTWYKDQIETWIPYDLNISGISDNNMGQVSYTERAKQ